MIVVKGRSLLVALALLVMAGVGVRMAVKPFDLGKSVRNAGLSIEDSYFKNMERYRAIIDKNRRTDDDELSASTAAGSDASNPAKTSEPPKASPNAGKVSSIKEKVSENVSDADSGFINAALEYKLQASRTRSERVENLKSVLAASGLSDDEKAKAEKSLLLLGDAKAKEADAETLLRAKGYGNVVASLDEGGLRIFIDKMLDIAEVASIGQAVANRTGLPLEQIIIAQRQGS